MKTKFDTPMYNKDTILTLEYIYIALVIIIFKVKTMLYKHSF